MRARFAATMLPFMALTACGGGNQPVLSTGGPPVVATQTPNPTNMFDVTDTASFEVLGALQTLTIDNKGAQLYRGNASTAAAPNGTITYSPRDGIFTVMLSDSAAGVTKNIQFQDPAHRATADVARIGNYSVPLLPGFNYLQALDGTAPFSFFYQRPGQIGAFVSLAGFERSDLSTDGSFISQQGVMVFGTKTLLAQLPSKGSASYTGQFLATMSGDTGTAPSVLQWINGTSTAQVDFGNRTVGLSLSGSVLGPAYSKQQTISDAGLPFPTGTTFTASASASWMAGSTGFAGKFSSASFKNGTGPTTNVDFTSVSAGTSVAGASSVDGTFYGPDAKNIGGNFRIIGGVPNQRVDILGAFVGVKP